MHEPDIAQPIRCIVKAKRDENKDKGLETLLDIRLSSGNRLQLLLESVCEDGYIGRPASIDALKGKNSADTLGENVTLKVESGVIHVADVHVETLQILSLNNHLHNTSAGKP